VLVQIRVDRGAQRGVEVRGAEALEQLEALQLVLDGPGAGLSGRCWLTNEQTKECISTLVEETGISIETSSALLRSLAREVLQVLGWNSHESYAKDIFSIVGEA
jgi:hypothetical protein